jgi:hypothetical protein
MFGVVCAWNAQILIRSIEESTFFHPRFLALTAILYISHHFFSIEKLTLHDNYRQHLRERSSRHETLLGMLHRSHFQHLGAYHRRFIDFALNFGAIVSGKKNMLAENKCPMVALSKKGNPNLSL